MKRPLAEILCDVFAAELLLRYVLFHPEAERASIGLPAIDNLARRFQASVTATDSRYAAVVSAPAAFVLPEQDKVRHIEIEAVTGSPAWIPPRLDCPKGRYQRKCVRVLPSKAAMQRMRTSGSATGNAGFLLEEVRHLTQSD